MTRLFVCSHAHYVVLVPAAIKQQRLHYIMLPCKHFSRQRSENMVVLNDDEFWQHSTWGPLRVIFTPLPV